MQGMGVCVFVRVFVCAQDGRSLEDKILHHNPMREDASDEEQGKSDDEREEGRYTPRMGCCGRQGKAVFARARVLPRVQRAAWWTTVWSVNAPPGPPLRSVPHPLAASSTAGTWMVL